MLTLEYHDRFRIVLKVVDIHHEGYITIQVNIKSSSMIRLAMS